MISGLHPQYLVDEAGQPRSVMLSIEEFHALLALIDEDYATDIEVLERAVDSETDFRPWREVRDEIEARQQQ